MEQFSYDLFEQQPVSQFENPLTSKDLISVSYLIFQSIKFTLLVVLTFIILQVAFSYSIMSKISTTVSYTHLDVYKRQVVFFAFFTPFILQSISSGSPSLSQAHIE